MIKQGSGFLVVPFLETRILKQIVLFTVQEGDPNTHIDQASYPVDLFPYTAPCSLFEEKNTSPQRKYLRESLLSTDWPGSVLN